MQCCAWEVACKFWNGIEPGVRFRLRSIGCLTGPQPVLQNRRLQRVRCGDRDDPEAALDLVRERDLGLHLAAGADYGESDDIARICGGYTCVQCRRIHPGPVQDLELVSGGQPGPLGGGTRLGGCDDELSFDFFGECAEPGFGRLDRLSESETGIAEILVVIDRLRSRSVLERLLE